ncbi:hypothetical protein [Coleofasciculus sp. FACHB-SPT36]|uniref:hypothetical protein n=1 Tax=Cyanophyceae TaxID=3028117 RepID=UPI001A7E3E0D|nr:hypothetical protein [Coleofasciculus sp. FACHB-SPT36]
MKAHQQARKQNLPGAGYRTFNVRLVRAFLGGNVCLDAKVANLVPLIEKTAE